ncbi:MULTISPECIES: phage holin [Mammaliicoccus]|uniref:PTS mannose transporter subunit IID n=1 Tax=Mammaliicoccus vitulinus TaxID=71237 RepID=A0A2T4PWI3_9STAP|nr:MULTISPECIES: phage holin [Mammaliicoccus]PNZ40258.1 PTS mannose transporter subunit IID [Mammaliicoccus vitulinus]PTI30823.1 PTS mannose transporter subunit IID [Mammaliicoccus vitulinus]PTI36731.1 PTS mannose transporter subunit IID [Mammaliicoccus vitulinus]PTI70089.1 PTS mannose transporter subunit IID [Mammaliicoccus vitulinus]QRO85407.1 PTS mannose transporter subunit IID [Mammaliicoccus vitulinus]
MVKMNFKTNKVNLNYSEDENKIQIDPDKVKQFVAMIGGFIGALYLALNASGVQVEWFNPQKLNAWMNVLNTGIPIVFVLYGIWKNTFILTNRSREQEQFLKQSGKK